MATDQNDVLWYKDAIIYELHIKAFYDSNGDGIGDFRGLLQKLDYLEDLGVTAVWVLPFYPSPLRDDGYDISDYFSINPSYGDVKDFKRFVKEAHKRDLKVITELVINHTSDQHPWFQRARRAKPNSSYRNYYVWSDDPSKYKDARIIFTDYEPSNWSWDPVAKSYYWHRFFSHQPDLNFDNPGVQKEILRIMEFWIKMGVDGFRLDAIPYLFERDNTNCENLPETHVFLKKLRKVVDQKYSNVIFLAEANMWPEEAASYFGDGDECHMNYHFPIMPRLFMAVRMEDRYPITDIIEQTPDIPHNCQWAIFLRNHDELTLEMVTDEERDYMYKVYTKDSQAKINLGIRRRLAPLLDNNRLKIELLNVLLFSLPGTPVLYYGDEIGMGDNFYLGDRNGVRTPMQWSPDRNAGFSEANPQKLYLPVIIDPQYKFDGVNVETQQANSSSLLWWMKRIMAIRKRFKAFGRGNIKFIESPNPKILAFTRTYEDEVVLVVTNLSRFPQPAKLELDEYKGYQPVEVINNNSFPRIKEEPYLFTMGPYAYFWFVLKKVADRRGKQERVLRELYVADWQNILNPSNKKTLLNQVIPDYFNQTYWFKGKKRKIHEVKILHQVFFREINALELILEFDYDEGLPEVYQLPISFATEIFVEQKKIRETRFLAKLKVGAETGYLIDGLYDERYQMAFLSYVTKRGGGKNKSKNFIRYDKLGKRITSGEIENLHTRVEGDRNNTALIYGGDYYLKYYRQIDFVENPETEILKYLNVKNRFANIPELKGTFHLGRFTLAFLQEAIHYQGDGWDYVRDMTKRYFERLFIEIETGSLEGVEKRPLDPIRYQDLDLVCQNLIGGDFAERIHLLGKRTGELHIALASGPEVKGFEHEKFSLHYQRSLYSPFQSLTREAFQALNKSVKKLPEEVREETKILKGKKNDVLKFFKRIYEKKIDALKIRIHGDFHLNQVLWTGRDFIVVDFEGEPLKSFTDRKIKRAPLRDVAGMLRSFQYAIYHTVLTMDYTDKESEKLNRWIDSWYSLLSGLYLNSYIYTVQGKGLIPEDKRDFNTLLQIFLMEKAVYELKFELSRRPKWTLIPIRGILSLLDNQDF